MNNLVFVLDRQGKQGKYDEAEQMYRQALELKKAVLGKEHPSTFTNMNNLAQAVLGKEHPFTLTNMNNLAGVLDRQGKYDEAEQMQRQALQLSQAVLGNEHPYILGSMNNLACVLRNQGKYDEAEQVSR
ncbi:hypothetical protein DL766_000390 [Monosporascus sp. MC13-8B]|nr:hypothetical protein DL766_000390 [Monosporascus sp. MC13-8B]